MPNKACKQGCKGHPFGLSCKITTFFSNGRGSGSYIMLFVNVGLRLDFIFSKDWKSQRFVVILHHERAKCNFVQDNLVTITDFKRAQVKLVACCSEHETMYNERRTIPQFPPTKGQKLTHHGIED